MDQQTHEAVARGPHRGSVAADRMQDAGLVPLEPYPGTNKGWRCRCTACGHEVAPSHANIGRGLNGCAWCAGNRIHAADAERVMRAANMEPLEPYPGDLKPWRCHCRTCDRKIRPRFANVQSGRGCRYCRNYGFDCAERGVV